MALGLRIDRVCRGRGGAATLALASGALVLVSAIGHRLIANDEPIGSFAAIALVLCASLGWRLSRDRRLMAGGTLQVDEGGELAWRVVHPGPPGAARHDEAAQALRPEAWCIGVRRVRISVRGAGDVAFDLWVDRTRCTEAQWRALRRWLIWLQRGGAAA